MLRNLEVFCDNLAWVESWQFARQDIAGLCSSGSVNVLVDYRLARFLSSNGIRLECPLAAKLHLKPGHCNANRLAK